MRATSDDDREAAELVERLIAECQRPSAYYDRPRDRSLQYGAAAVCVLALSAVLVGSVIGWAVTRLAP